MKYDLLPEFKKYSLIRSPANSFILKLANLIMPVIQRGKKPDSCLTQKKINCGKCTATLIMPKNKQKLPLLVYYHGGGYILKAAAYHKNLALDYAAKANCAVLFVDYRLAPAHKFPVPVTDCFEGYLWALNNLDFSKVAVGGDSAGADLAIAVTRLAYENDMRIPDGLMLVYPMAGGEYNTKSMAQYADAPMWNAKVNKKALRHYTGSDDPENALVRPLRAESFAFFPPAYLETAQYDCLCDGGKMLAERLLKDGVKVTQNNTLRTMHGYDIAQKSPYVKAQVNKRVDFLRGIFNKNN